MPSAPGTSSACRASGANHAGSPAWRIRSTLIGTVWSGARPVALKADLGRDAIERQGVLRQPQLAGREADAGMGRGSARHPRPPA